MLGRPRGRWRRTQCRPLSGSAFQWGRAKAELEDPFKPVSGETRPRALRAVSHGAGGLAGLALLPTHPASSSRTRGKQRQPFILPQGKGETPSRTLCFSAQPERGDFSGGRDERAFKVEREAWENERAEKSISKARQVGAGF